MGTPTPSRPLTSLAAMSQLAEAPRAEASPRRLDAPAFTRLYERTYQGLWAYLHRLAGEASVADDLAQEAYVRLFERPPGDARPLEPYLYRVATNLFYDHWRRRDLRRRLAPRRPPPRRDEPEQRHDLEAMFTTLRPRDRALLWLAHVEGHDHREIAAILGLRPLSVRVMLSRARRRLARLLEDHR